MPLLPSQWIFHTFLWSVLCLFWWYSSHECFECSLCWTLTSLMWRFFFSVLKTAKYFRHHFPTHSENKVLFNKKKPHPKNTDPNRFSIKRRVLFENQSCLIGLVFWFFFLLWSTNWIEIQGNTTLGPSFPYQYPELVHQRTGEFADLLDSCSLGGTSAWPAAPCFRRSSCSFSAHVHPSPSG